ncbi:nucleotidyltransferase family protein [Cytophagaceae bacterium 50C-KIRBA]|uniref:Nucleotidyltransferase family protein n=1 Tax=Aquirufa beregesia TaxID=2516556 RepID=A0ABX0EUF6_9BACT|nr:nucleotidyltransferase family protein [Aquirufa beregesia]NGZ42917.1 nucleotidyltransferase family protein [Aquirufa beregesia]
MLGVLLAAGASSRLGEPKALLRLGQKTLIERSLQVLQAPFKEEIVVVLGAEKEAVRSIISQEQVEILESQDWALGQGNTLAECMRALAPRKEAILLMLVDTPFVQEKHLHAILEAHQENASQVIISSFRGQSSPPVLIPFEHQHKLHDWKGDKGFGPFWKSHPDICRWISFEEEYRDLDTPEDKKYWQENWEK